MYVFCCPVLVLGNSTWSSGPVLYMVAQMSLDHIRFLWWSGGAALWHIKLHLSYLDTCYQAGQGTSSNIHTRKVFQKVTLADGSENVTFLSGNALYFFFFKMAKKNDTKDRFLKALYHIKRKIRATIAAIDSNIPYIHTGVLLLLWRRISMGSQGQTRVIHRSLVKEKLLCISTLTPGFYSTTAHNL